jgi:hypothetical protein
LTAIEDWRIITFEEQRGVVRNGSGFLSQQLSERDDEN